MCSIQAICIRTAALHVHSKSVDRSIAPFLKGRGLLKVSLPLHLSGLVSRPSGPNVTPEGMLPDCAIACVPRYMGSRTQHRVIDNTRFLIQPRYTQPEYAKKKEHQPNQNDEHQNEDSNHPTKTTSPTNKYSSPQHDHHSKNNHNNHKHTNAYHDYDSTYEHDHT